MKILSGQYDWQIVARSDSARHYVAAKGAEAHQAGKTQSASGFERQEMRDERAVHEVDDPLSRQDVGASTRIVIPKHSGTARIIAMLDGAGNKLRRDRCIAQ